MKKLSEIILIISLTGTFFLFFGLLNASQDNKENIEHIYKRSISVIG